MTKEKISLIADTVHGTIQISKIEKEIISSSIFNRLHDISQNSTAYLTFPSNRTKRFEHSVGTMYLAGQMFYYCIMNADERVRDKFFSQLDEIISKKIRSILEDGNDTYKAQLHDRNYKESVLTEYKTQKFISGISMVDQWIPHNIKEEQKYMFMALIQSVRLAGLMHDAGHPPFSHIAEYAMRDVWRNIEVIEEKKRSQGQKSYYNALKAYFSNGGELHEKIGNQITERLLTSIQKIMPESRKESEKKLPAQLYRVMVKEMTSAILDEKNSFFRSIHGIIAGSLDADRLDYVTRDMMNSGLNVGKIEYDRLIPKMKLIINEEGEIYFCPSINSVNVLEDFFNRRWNLYKKIIFHHRVIKTDFLLGDCIKNMLDANLKEVSEEGIDEKVLPYDISGLWKAVKSHPSHDVFFNRLIQWDDGWLMVVLKKAFLQMDENEDEVLKDKFRELLAGEKHYYSFVKNVEMFNEIETEVINAMLENIDTLNILLKDILEEGQSVKTNVDKAMNFEIKPFCKDLQSMIDLIESYTERTFQEKGFILGRISRLIFDNYFEEGEFQKLIRESVEQMKNESKINDVIVVFKTIKSGIQESLMLYDREDKLVSYKNISNTAINLKLQREFVLPFYIYINAEQIDKIDYKGVRRDIGKKIGHNMMDFFEKSLKQWISVLQAREDALCAQ